jgi:hypothetical protein
MIATERHYEEPKNTSSYFVSIECLVIQKWATKTGG